MAYTGTANDYLETQPVNGASTWGLIKWHLWTL